RTIDADVLAPKGVLVVDDKTETVTPSDAPAPVGGAAGTASNIAVEGAPGDATVAAVTPPAPATTSDQKRKYETGRTKTRTVHSAPTLQRMSVSLVLDESLAAKKDEIARVVEAIVGFEKTRDDVLSVSTTTIAAPDAALPDGKSPAAAVSEGMSPTLKMLLQHGVELLAAAVFLFIALKTLKGSKRGVLASSAASGASPAGLAGARRGASAAPDVDDVEPDPELIARMRVEELVRTDPRRVGEILSRWATETTKTAGASR
ncbi:MAG TPA: flagellar M-ring protein FliF C-terminal domain-containing protein, partial [Planctomycetota bacterium]|nr:flagellar M-ring protein FliF C-terminal domain-containing protein [Planctomycetota bacterium]